MRTNINNKRENRSPSYCIIPFPLPHRYHSDSILYLYRRLRRTILLEKCEMYASVATLFYKVWMVVKVICL